MLFVTMAMLVSVLLGACGGESADSADRGADAADAETAGSARDGRGRGGAASESNGNGNGNGNGDSIGRGGGGGLSAGEICDLIPADDVEAALGISSVVASPSSSHTPQCSYVFENEDGMRGDATISALRTEEDLGGRQGEEAFEYVVDLNSGAAPSGEPTRTNMSVGDQAVLLSGENLHFGVVRLGARIVTTIVTVRAADVEAAMAFSGLTSSLAP